VVVMEVGGLGRLLLRTKCDKSVVLVFFFIHLSFAGLAKYAEIARIAESKKTNKKRTHEYGGVQVPSTHRYQ